MFLELPHRPLDSTPACRAWREKVLLFCDQHAPDLLALADQGEQRPAKLAEAARLFLAEWRRWQLLWPGREDEAAWLSR